MMRRLAFNPVGAVIDVPLTRLVFAESEAGVLNPRGDVTDTTDLQDSLRLAGQRSPIQVLHSDDGSCTVIDGHRRVVAARALKWTSIRAEVVGIGAGEDQLLAAMLASNVRQDVKPTALGRAISRLSLAKSWGIERVAKLAGMPADRARLLVELASAPESVQRRVDAGQMSLSAWKALRDKPRMVQERAAGLPNPTVVNVRRAAREEASAGVLADMLDRMDAEHTLVTLLNEARGRLLAEWHALGDAEKTRARALIETIQEFVSATAPVAED